MIKVGSYVEVLPLKDNGKKHPQAGKRGTVLELGAYVDRAFVKIARGYEEAGNIMIVSPRYLKEVG